VLVDQAEIVAERRPFRILVVEDQEDVRRLLVTALQLEGHDVDEAGNAHEGLQRLRQGGYKLVLSDYAMPGGTGAWMLHEAAREGLLQHTAALILTAHPDVRDFTDIEVIPKPLNFGAFLEQVKTLLAGSHDSGGRQGVPHELRRVELVLYISSASAASLQARRNLEHVLQQFEPSQIQLSVFDLERQPLAGDQDRVAFTPTLVKRFPGPPMWIVGNLKEQEALCDLLHACGVDAKA
jgi:CheY-like chemotaxis protein